MKVEIFADLECVKDEAYFGPLVINRGDELSIRDTLPRDLLRALLPHLAAWCDTGSLEVKAPCICEVCGRDFTMLGFCPMTLRTVPCRGATDPKE